MLSVVVMCSYDVENCDVLGQEDLYSRVVTRRVELKDVVDLALHDFFERRQYLPVEE
jgi:hypothetical protein